MLKCSTAWVSALSPRLQWKYIHKSPWRLVPSFSSCCCSQTIYIHSLPKGRGTPGQWHRATEQNRAANQSEDSWPFDASVVTRSEGILWGGRDWALPERLRFCWGSSFDSEFHTHCGWWQSSYLSRPLPTLKCSFLTLPSSAPFLPLFCSSFSSSVSIFSYT